jgi:uncharacterized protein (DUF1684 family)
MPQEPPARPGAGRRARHENRAPGARAIARVLGAFAFVGLGLAAASCRPNTEQARPYPERIAAQRAEKDAYFQAAPDSPIPADKRAEFLPLAYFPLDPEYAASAQIVPSQREPAMEMPTSTGQRRMMRRAGTLQFSVKGQSYGLTAFVEADAPDMNRLFVPFGDMTNGTETYAAGRYLDLQRTPTGLYEVDFNRAYQPYCYYNATYDCPYPPPENRLKLPVRAGERMRPSR